MKCKNCNQIANHTKTIFIEGKVIEQCNNCSDIGYIASSSDNSVVAIYADKNNKPYAVNKKGNIVENHSYKNDAKGWKTAGKKNIKY